jgi:hypothetical protein
MSESEMKVMTKEEWSLTKAIINNHDDQMQAMGHRIIALERGLEGVLRRLEASSSPDDEAGWFGRPE